MIKFINIDETDTKTLEDILNAHAEIVGEYSGKFFKYNMNDSIGYLYKKDDLITCYYFDNDYLYYQIFYVDENYNITKFDWDDYIVDLTGDSLFFNNYEKNLYSSISMVKRKNGDDIDGYNGVIGYTQYNPLNNMTATIAYQYMFSKMREKDVIYDFHMKEPLEVIISVGPDGKHPKSFVSRSAKRGTLLYEIMLKKDKQSVYEQNDIKRYYRVLFKDHNDYAVTGFPFCPQYTIQNIEAMLKEKGFNLYIPESIREFYNDYLKIIKDYQEIAFELGRLEEKIKDVEAKSLTLKLGDNNA